MSDVINTETQHTFIMVGQQRILSFHPWTWFSGRHHLFRLVRLRHRVGGVVGPRLKKKRKKWHLDRTYTLDSVSLSLSTKPRWLYLIRSSLSWKNGTEVNVLVTRIVWSTGKVLLTNHIFSLLTWIHKYGFTFLHSVRKGIPEILLEFTGN